ncbi:hypothetical protein [Singulisphaera sp. PoT]|uniref:hypothetical protein n=1 Tax=Singulisphaera sp. PoT TaxID=3411797 RepID=UPI003BF4A2B7
MTSKYVRLSDETRRRFDANPRLWPKVRQFKRFFRDVKGHRGEVERKFPALRAGRPVDRVIGEAFVEYLREVLGLLEIEAAEALVDATNSPSLGVWDTPNKTLDALAERLQDNDLMYLHNPVKDSLLAAGMELDTVGWKLAGPGEPMDVDSCIARGERFMRRTRQEYARWMREVTRLDGMFRTVMFYLRGEERIGISVALPLKERAWRAMAAGELFDSDLTQDDLLPSSRFIYMHGMSDAERVDIANHDKTLAQARSVFYQVAYYVRNARPLRPMSLSPCCCAYYGELLRKHGYKPTGACMKDTPNPMMMLGHHKDGGSRIWKDRVSYDISRLTVRAYLICNRAHWRREDRSIGLI